jgi:hypothetical protein
MCLAIPACSAGSNLLRIASRSRTHCGRKINVGALLSIH